MGRPPQCVVRRRSGLLIDPLGFVRLIRFYTPPRRPDWGAACCSCSDSLDGLGGEEGASWHPQHGQRGEQKGDQGEAVESKVAGRAAFEGSIDRVDQRASREAGEETPA